MTDETSIRITYDASNNDSIFIASNQVQAVKIPPSPIVHITGANGQPLVSVHPDGRTEFGDGYQPDEAARAFWDAVQRLVPPGMVREYGRPLTASINEHLKAGQEAEQHLKRVREWATSEPVTARSEFGNGYREALRDIRDLLSGATEGT